MNKRKLSSDRPVVTEEMEEAGFDLLMEYTQGALTGQEVVRAIISLGLRLEHSGELECEKVP